MFHDHGPSYYCSNDAVWYSCYYGGVVIIFCQNLSLLLCQAKVAENFKNETFHHDDLSYDCSNNAVWFVGMVVIMVVLSLTCIKLCFKRFQPCPHDLTEK